MSKLYTCENHKDDYDFCPFCKIEELKADAMRYQWLKSNAESQHEKLDPSTPNLYCPSWKFSSFGWDEKIDELIDKKITKDVF